jgi:hypothetical protein
MIESLRREYARLLTSGAQLLLLAFAARLHSRSGWLASLGAIALLSLFAWLSALARLRALRETPVSKIGTAAQGYVELSGSARPMIDGAACLTMRGRACLWSRYSVERRSGNGHWNNVDRGETTDSFVLRDASGECLLDPEPAEISTEHYEQWIDDDCRYSEWSILEGDLLFVTGDFRTRRGGDDAPDARAALNDLLATWKKDMPALLARFDLDRDGELNPTEWAAAVQAARDQVRHDAGAAAAMPEVNLVGRPRDGRPYLITNIPKDKLERRYGRWSLAHLLIFFAALGGLAYALTWRG